MIDTRTMAVVMGALSLAFGVGATAVASPALALAAGALGLLAGLMALVGTRTPVPDQPDHTGPSAAPGNRAGVPGGADPADTAGRATAAAGAGAGEAEARDADVPLDLGDTALLGAADAPDDHTASSDATGPRRRRGDAPGTPVRASSTEVADTPASPGSQDPADPDSSPSRPATPLTDTSTGLFSEDYLVAALEGRLASARRHLRPVALAVMEVHRGMPTEGPSPADPAVVAKAITDTVRDSDIACRLDDGTFGLILEDTPENGAVWTIERIRRNLVSSSGHHTLWAGVACYPAHAFEESGLMEQVTEALAAAREWNQDRIEVALPE